MICSEITAQINLAADMDPSADARRERLHERRLESLDRLAEVGLQIAEAIGRCVAAMAEDVSAQAPCAAEGEAAGQRIARLNTAAIAYPRAARAVRLTLALQAKMARRGPNAADAAAGDDHSVQIGWMQDPAQVRAQQTRRVQRLVSRVAGAADVSGEALERVAAEAAERLEDEDLYGDLLSRPMGEILAHICRDLGLDPDWGRLADEPWAQDEIRIGRPASPFAPWMAGGPLSRRPKASSP